MKKYRFAIEIGGAYTKIYVKDFGIVLCEPTLVAAKANASGYEIVGLGTEAKKLMGKTGENVEIFSPIINGQVSNYEYLKELINYFFDKIEIKRKKENIIALVNCAINEKEKTNLRNLLNAVGFGEVALVPTVICSCVGAGKNISSTKTNMVINIGGANTDIAVINMNSIIKGATLGLGGKAVEFLTGEKSQALRESIMMLGSMVIGAVAATWVDVKTVFQMTNPDTGEVFLDLNQQINSVLPKGLTAIFVLLCWYLISKKKMSPLKVMLLLVVVAFVGVVIGFFDPQLTY